MDLNQVMQDNFRADMNPNSETITLTALRRGQQKVRGHLQPRQVRKSVKIEEIDQNNGPVEPLPEAQQAPAQPFDRNKVELALNLNIYTVDLFWQMRFKAAQTPKFLSTLTEPAVPKVKEPIIVEINLP